MNAGRSHVERPSRLPLLDLNHPAAQMQSSKGPSVNEDMLCLCEIRLSQEYGIWCGQDADVTFDSGRGDQIFCNL